ncbi:MAG: hypothetical protein IT378_09985 [Sandaracinaceae bacterium]|nr:hypothetical protein [Sandaracinaceae bacterium]
MIGSRALLACALVAAPVAASAQSLAQPPAQTPAQSPSQETCPPARPAPICLLVRLRDPSAAGVAALRERLRADGIRSAGGARSFSIAATPARLRRAFGLRVRYGRTGASSRPVVICTPLLPPRIAVPERYRDLILSLSYDPQVC